ncbi:MAG: hypothetical protein M1826_003938 [Phylliscum demangeonii]|nr:MAG: hypothetical protein M1826_003938 [Phylliscum demangeonii]
MTRKLTKSGTSSPSQTSARQVSSWFADGHVRQSALAKRSKFPPESSSTSGSGPEDVPGDSQREDIPDDLAQLSQEYRRTYMNTPAAKERHDLVKKTIENPMLKLVTTDEIQRYKVLKQAYNQVTAIHQRRRLGSKPKKTYPDVSAERRAELDELEKAHWHEFGRTSHTAERKRLRNLLEKLPGKTTEGLDEATVENLNLDEPTKTELKEVTLKKLDRFRTLRDARNERVAVYDREKRSQKKLQTQQNPKTCAAGGPSTCTVDSSLAEYYHKRYNQFRRKYVSTPKARELARQASRSDAPEELRNEHDALHSDAKAWLRLLCQERRPSLDGVNIDIPASLANYVPRLETYRVNYNIYKQFFSGSHRAAWREQLKQGIAVAENGAMGLDGEAALETFQELYPSYLHFNRLYDETWTKAVACRHVETARFRAVVPSGRSRWMRPRGSLSLARIRRNPGIARPEPSLSLKEVHPTSGHPLGVLRRFLTSVTKSFTRPLEYVLEHPSLSEAHDF